MSDTSLAKSKIRFSSNLQKLVKQTGFSENEYREKAGFSSATWYNYLRGVRLPREPGDAERLAKVAGVSPAFLYGWDASDALPDFATDCATITLEADQLGYPSGTAIHYKTRIKGPTDGTYVLSVKSQIVLRKIKIRLDDDLDISDGKDTETYTRKDFKTFKVLGKASGVTLSI